MADRTSGHPLCTIIFSIMSLMNKMPVQYILICIIIMSSCVRQAKYNKLSDQKDSLQVVSDFKTEQLEMITSYIDTIASSIDSITHQEVLLLSRTNPDGVRLPQKKIKENLELLEALINRQRSRIQELDSTLIVMSDSTNRLRSVVSYLYSQLEEKDIEIQRMKAEIGQQNKRIRTLSSQVSLLQKDVNALTEKSREQTEAILAQNETIIQQDSILYTAYYIADTKKNLKEKGILSGSAFNGDKIDMNNTYMSVCTKVDIRKFTSLEIYGKKVKILSAMPSEAYQIRKLSVNKYMLFITDSKSFWSASRVLIIQIV